MESVQQKQTATPTSVNNLVKVNPVERRQIVNRAPVVNTVLNNAGEKQGIGTKMDNLINFLTKEEMQKDTDAKRKKWNFPFKWKRTMNRSLKNNKTDMVLCFFINKTGELEPPVLLPIYNGNTLIYKYTVHELDPRDIITLNYKRKTYKLLIYQLVNRKAISNRNYAEIRARGDGTIDDEVFIKAMLTAKASQISKQQIGKGALIIGGLAVAGIIIWFFSRS